MLQPTKYSHADRTVINVAQWLLVKLIGDRIVKYDCLRTHLRKKVPGTDILYLPALNFLYLMGVVEYHPKTDSIEYIGPNENI